jgi:hypothetical protein
MNPSVSARPARRARPGSNATETDTSGRILRAAVNLVFGMPFLFCLLTATRGHLWLQTHRMLGDGVGRAAPLLWPVIASLGALWLGVSLMLQPVPQRRPTGALLVLAGSALLVLLHP